MGRYLNFALGADVASWRVDESFDSLLTVSDSGDGSGSGIGERVMTWRRAPSGRS